MRANWKSWQSRKNMTCSSRDHVPRLGQELSWRAIPDGWAVKATGTGMAAKPLVSPVWRIVRVRRGASGWLVTVAAFRA